jgi:MFS-type transporter involved in bile tolerance (Atg22 family)
MIPRWRRMFAVSEALSGCLNATIHSYHSWYADIYNFIYAAIIRIIPPVVYDKKLHDVERRYPQLWAPRSAGA